MAASIRSAITICLVPEARHGPFVFHEDLEAACAAAAEHGFDAVEVFPRSAEETDVVALKKALAAHGLGLAAMGTGAGALVRKLTLCDPDAEVRRRAVDFIAGIIDLASGWGAPAIIGSMQGNAAGADDKARAMGCLGEALEQLSPRAAAAGVPLLVEPLNRYESNLLNRLEETADWLGGLKAGNVRILADLFHMNIEERSMGGAIRRAGERVGHVHLADSNRWAAGFGHSDLAGAAQALREVGFNGHVSAEVFPQPDPQGAARRTIETYRQLFAP